MFFKVVGPPVLSTTLLNLLDFIAADTVVLKIDVEGYECKVLHPYLKKAHPHYFLPYILMEWKHIAANRDSSCPDFQGFISSLYNSGYTPIDMDGNNKEDQQVPEKLEEIGKMKLFNKELLNVLWVHKKATALFW